jgi:hypothetical protein
MMDRQHGMIIFECDVCGDTLETGERDFNEAKAIQDREGWKARKIGSDWCHSCPDCGVPGERAPLAKNARLL